MIALLLTSSTGISYAQHFCGGVEMLSQIMLGEKEFSCGINVEIPDCTTKTSDHGCCDSHYTSIDTDDHFAKAKFQIDFKLSTAIAAVPVNSLQVDRVYDIQSISYAEYHPPPLEQDIQVLFSTFLI